MSISPSSSSYQTTNNKYKGVRQRKWGKWVSEIRVPSTPERLWLGSYATPEAAAIAHDVAYYCLRGESSPRSLNFYPLNLPAGAHVGLSPRSVQKVASDAGLAVDARLKSGHIDHHATATWQQRSCWEAANWSNEADHDRDQEEYLSISVEDYL